MSIKRHTLQNLGGSLVPMVVALVSVPIYLHLIGPARYGILSIIWLFLGYFGLFDLGLARASSYHIARLHDATPAARASVFYTALAVNAGFGIIGGGILYLLAPPLFEHFFKITEESRQAILMTLPWLAIAIPVATIGGVLLGALQAREAFGTANVISALNTFLVQISPLFVAWLHGPDISWLIISVVLSRMFGLVPFIVFVYRMLPLGQGGKFEAGQLPALFSYGGWILITNILDPFLNTMDRILIGGLIGPDSVAYYSVPFSLVTRITTLPVGLATSLFPRLSRNTAEDSAALSAHMTSSLAAILTPIIVVAIVVLPIFMRLWVGEIFAEHATSVGIILLVGIWGNSLAFIPYSQLQAANRPDITAKLHLLQIIPFLAALWCGVKYGGLLGAAVVWSVRASVDCLMLFLASHQMRALIKVLPGMVWLLCAVPFAPSTIISLHALFSIVVVMLSVGWAVKMEPRLLAVGAIFKFR